MNRKSRQEPVRVGRSATGKGIFATRRYRPDDLIGEILGERIPGEGYGSDYCFQLSADWNLEPQAPFRYINHSCDPNCEFDCLVVDQTDETEPYHRLFLFASRDIEINEQLTIEYNWSADGAIPCRCGAETCRGWVVAPSELPRILAREDR